PQVILEYATSSDFSSGVKCMDGTLPANNTGGVCPSVANGSGSSGNFSYAWHVPDDISRGTKPYFIRIRDKNDAGVNHIFPSGAGNGFKIKSKLDMTS